jgi:16S rRNA (cytosine967-C5)-methyltransferase
VIGDTGAIRLVEPQPLRTLPEWDTGAFAAQDLGAQLAAGLQIPLLQQRANSVRQPRDQPLLILDACAAPGGKLCHLLEASAANHLLADIVGLDVQPRRVEETRRLASHLGHVPNLIVGDATRRDWWDGVAFDHILLDAPCSGTGTLRRHPDIKVLLQPADIVSHATLQRDMLDNLWHTLAPGGTLLYCTCSILNNENDDVIDSFLEANAAATQDATVLTFSLTTGSATRRGWQLLPIEPDTDGFYYALLAKQADEAPE